MTPAEYVEKPPAFTAVEWDGTQESANWITQYFPGATYNGESLTVRDAMDRDTALEFGAWIVRNDSTTAVFQISGDEFTHLFAPAE